MTKKHYVAIAEILRETKDWEAIVNRMADFLKRDNSRFDVNKFWDSCHEKNKLPRD